MDIKSFTETGKSLRETIDAVEGQFQAWVDAESIKVEQISTAQSFDTLDARMGTPSGYGYSFTLIVLYQVEKSKGSSGAYMTQSKEEF